VDAGSLRPARRRVACATSWSRASAASPACPMKSARLPRLARVAGCSGPRTRSWVGSSAAYWSRAPAASPACPVQPARLPGGQSVRVLGAKEALEGGSSRRTDHGLRPRPLPARSSWRGCPGSSRCPGARGRGPAPEWAAARRTDHGPRPRPPPNSWPPRSAGTRARLSAHDIASMLTSDRPAPGRRARPRGRAWAQFWAHSPPSRAVHLRPHDAHLHSP
jgi:hypothetical protein